MLSLKQIQFDKQDPSCDTQTKRLDARAFIDGAESETETKLWVLLAQSRVLTLRCNKLLSKVFHLH